MSSDSGLLDPSEWGVYLSEPFSTITPLASLAFDSQLACSWDAALCHVTSCLAELAALPP